MRFPRGHVFFSRRNLSRNRHLDPRRAPLHGTYQPLSGNPKSCVELAADYLNEVAAAHLLVA
jgi:hypothetical protein